MTTNAADSASLYEAAQKEIAERRRTEAALRESENRFRQMADSAPVMVWVTDVDGKCTFVSKSWYAFTGRSEDEALGNAWAEAVHPEDREKLIRSFTEAIAEQRDLRQEYRLRRADGTWCWCIVAAVPRLDDTGRFCGHVGSVLDIADRKQAEEERERLVRALREMTRTLETRVAERTQELAAANADLRGQIEERERVEEALRQAQKMEGIGQLTGGIAHDFNNLLTIIIGNLETIQRQMTRNELQPDQLARWVENAHRGAMRAAALTQRLLAFSRRQPLEPMAVDANRLVENISDLLRRTLGETIQVATVLSPGLWWIHADPNQLENAILNLAVNARDAMPQGGKLTIETANAFLDEGLAARRAEVAPGQYVVLCISDTGSGMSRETMAKAFEPFFTTKDTGHGTGLGLSQVYGFVKQSGGHVKIYSELGEGTTVKIYLPRLLAPPHEAGAPETPQPEGRPAEQGRATILVVEDDEDVRRHSVELLRDLGYHVLDVPDGEAALDALSRHPEVKLLFTDVGLPGGMNGRQLADAARAQRPDLPVLFTTGYARDAIVHDGRLDPGVQLVTKPFTYETLAGRVHDILVGHPDPARILIVEDEPLVQMVIADGLVDLGYAVEPTASAAEALDKMRSLNGAVDAAVVDVGLPDRRGDDLAAELRAADAALPIVLASGYDSADLRTRFAGDGRMAYLEKPYEAQQLAAILAGFGLKPKS